MDREQDAGEALDPKTGEPFRLAHAIDRDVWNARYLEYAPQGRDIPHAVSEDELRDLFVAGLLPLEPAANQLKDMSKQINHADLVGCIIIRRFPVSGEAPIPPELRHWEPMLGRTVYHYHGEDGNEHPVRPDTKPGEPVKPLHLMQIQKARLKDGEYTSHIRGKRNTVHLWRNDEWVEQRDALGKKIAHCGVNTDEVHKHVEEQKYRFLPTPTKREDKPHTHERLLGIYVEHALDCPARPDVWKNGIPKVDMALWGTCECSPRFKTKVWDETAKRKRKVMRIFDTLAEAAEVAPTGLLDFLAGHAAKRHEGDPMPDDPFVFLAEPHMHTYSNKGDVQIADRIDVHPLALPLFEGASRAFFVIEGCIKADAILSRDREPVFSVPSVTLWDIPELEQFVRDYLLGKLVVVVPDADWDQNPLVLTQALLCCSTLQKYGVRACVAAPPSPPLDRPDDKGVDDFYAANPTATADGLVVLDRQVDTTLIYQELKKWAKDRTIWSNKLASMSAALEGLALHAGIRGRVQGRELQEGEFCGSITPLARILDLDPSTVKEAIEDLEAHGAVEIVEGSLKVREGSYRGGYFSREADWVDAPTIRVAPQFQATTTRRGTLREAQETWAANGGVDFARNVVVPFNLLERARAIAAFGTPIDKIMQRANVSKAQAKRASAQAKRLPEGMKVPWRGGVLFVYSNLVGPSTFRFDGRRGGRLFFGLLNASSDSLTCRVLGPTNRKPSPPLWEGELEPESGLVVQLLPTFTGKYRVEFEGQAQLAVGEIAPAVDAVAQLRADGLYETYDGRVFTADGKPHRRLVAVV